MVGGGWRRTACLCQGRVNTTSHYPPALITPTRPHYLAWQVQRVTPGLSSHLPSSQCLPLDLSLIAQGTTMHQHIGLLFYTVLALLLFVLSYLALQPYGHFTF